MKLIFLDIDGVMNHRTHFERSRQHEGQEFSPLAVRNLREILKATGARIVVSSTWRKMGAARIKEIFRYYDLQQYILGMTPVIDDVIRGQEIQWFINQCTSPIECFVILDDDDDMGELLPFLVQTSNTHGLTDDKRDEAIKILNEQKKSPCSSCGHDLPLGPSGICYNCYSN